MDLTARVEVPESEIGNIVGNGRANGRTKCSAVLEVAANLLALDHSVHTDADYEHDRDEHRSVDRRALALGPVIQNYLACCSHT